MKLQYGLMHCSWTGAHPPCRRDDMASGLRGLVGAFIAGSLIVSSTAAGAATTAVDHQVNPWAVLSAMSGGAPAAAMCGAATTAATAQGPTGCVLPVMDAAPPP